MAVNKVIINGVTKIDISNDTVEPSKVLSTYTFHDHEGEPQTGSCTFDSDTSTDTAQASEILATKTAHARGSALTGTMPNRGAVAGSIAALATPYTVPQGYHDGSGTVGIDSTEAAKIIAGNIKSGIEILGVTGTYAGEPVTTRAATATPTFAEQTILPGTGYDYLTQVTIDPIPVTETATAGGGTTVTVGSSS